MTLELDPPPGIDFRPAEPDDYGFAEKLYFESTRPLLHALGTWDKAAVSRRFSEAFDRYPSQVLQAGGADIGWLQVSRNETAVHVHQMHLVRRWRNRGIGAHLIGQIKARASELGLPVTLKVIRGNPAITLYKRLGFRTVAEEPELFRMRWDPPGQTGTAGP